MPGPGEGGHPRPPARPGLSHLAAAVGQRSARDIASHVGLTRPAGSGGLDFLTWARVPGGPGPDVLAVLSQAPPATHRVGVTATAHTDAPRVLAAVAPWTGSAAAA
ncbi:hypothetical protein [Streptomyces naganishii]|uniref:hypothetical protein n=1 Tax=Streptomyces naganishii TaxID=285447 RepID=UPI00167CB5EA|nr:hypothetical protein [Streptomyces naganishii]